MLHDTACFMLQVSSLSCELLLLEIDAKQANLKNMETFIIDGLTKLKI